MSVVFVKPSAVSKAKHCKRHDHIENYPDHDFKQWKWWQQYKVQLVDLVKSLADITPRVRGSLPATETGPLCPLSAEPQGLLLWAAIVSLL